MALIEATTPSGRHRLLQALAPEARAVAFAAANPVLAREVGLLATDVRRIRKLSADTACEALSWIDDPELIAAIANADHRNSVCMEARRRLRALQVAEIPKISPNQDNIRLRTTKALEQPLDAIPAALGEIKELYTDAVEDWFTALDTGDTLAVLPRMVEFGNLVSVLRNQCRPVIEQLSAAAPDDAIACIDRMFRHDGGKLVSADLLRSWPSPWGLAAAHLAALWDTTPSMQRPHVEPDARSLWAARNRFDLILWAGLASPEEIVGAARRATTGADALALLALVNRREDVDVLVATLADTGVLETVNQTSTHRNSNVFERLMNLRGLAAETVKSLLLASPFPVQTSWLYSRYNNKPTRELVEVLAATLNAADISRTLHRFSGSRDECDAMLWLLEAGTARRGGAEVIAELTGSYLRTGDEILDWIATRTQAAFGSDEASWSVFWTLLAAPGESSFDELLSSVKALA